MSRLVPTRVGAFEGSAVTHIGLNGVDPAVYFGVAPRKFFDAKAVAAARGTFEGRVLTLRMVEGRDNLQVELLVDGKPDLLNIIVGTRAQPVLFDVNSNSAFAELSKRAYANVPDAYESADLRLLALRRVIRAMLDGVMPFKDEIANLDRGIRRMPGSEAWSLGEGMHAGVARLQAQRTFSIKAHPLHCLVWLVGFERTHRVEQGMMVPAPSAQARLEALEAKFGGLHDALNTLSECTREGTTVAASSVAASAATDAATNAMNKRKRRRR